MVNSYIFFFFLRLPFSLFFFFTFTTFFLNRFFHLESINLFFTLLCQHFGLSVFWFPVAILFLSRKNKFLIKVFFFFLIPVGISILVGILWFGSEQQLFYFFGFFAIFSRNLFSNLFLQILFLFFYTYALYLIISRYQLHFFWKDFFYLFAQKRLWKKKIPLGGKKIDKILFITYTKGILKKCSQFLRYQKFSRNRKAKEITDIKKIPISVRESWKSSSSSDSSLSELLSVFRA